MAGGNARDDRDFAGGVKKVTVNLHSSAREEITDFAAAPFAHSTADGYASDWTVTDSFAADVPSQTSACVDRDCPRTSSADQRTAEAIRAVMASLFVMYASRPTSRRPRKAINVACLRTPKLCQTGFCLS